MEADETPPDAELTAAVKAVALELGFVRAGVARAGCLDAEGERLRAWLAAGKHGEMAWMERTADVRINPRDERMLAGAESVLVLATPYARDPERVGPAPGRVARYARGRDYHNVLGKRLEKLTRWLRERGHGARGSVDSMPVFERAWAQRAGLGFIGKNSCLIIPGLGSHVFLSAVVTTARLVPDTPMRERCGACTLCLDGCPTSAFDGARELDARKCISYLTIEHEGRIDEALRPAVGDWIFGCDVCQDVCPYNRTELPPPSVTAPFAPSTRWDAHDAESILEMSDHAFGVYSEGSPVRRTGRDGMARNAAVVLGNRGERCHLPVLDNAARTHLSPVVRETAAWAARTLRERLDEQK